MGILTLRTSSHGKFLWPLSLPSLILYHQYLSSTAFRLNLIFWAWYTRYLTSAQPTFSVLTFTSASHTHCSRYQNHILSHQHAFAHPDTPAWNIFPSHPCFFHLMKPQGSLKTQIPCPHESFPVDLRVHSSSVLDGGTRWHHGTGYLFPSFGSRATSS